MNAMPHIVTALFKDPAKAEQALQALLEMGLAQSQITAIGLSRGRDVSSISGFRTLSAPDDARREIAHLELPEDDLRLFARGLQQGCGLVAARVDRDRMDEAVRLLEMFDPADLDSASREWEAEASRGAGADAGAPLGAGLTGGTAEGLTNTAALPGMGELTGGGTSLGTSDLRTREGAGPEGTPDTTVPTGPGTDLRREDRPGVNQLRQDAPAPPPDREPFQRDLNRRGPVRLYGGA
jgi:hypothetical protein